MTIDSSFPSFVSCAAPLKDADDRSLESAAAASAATAAESEAAVAAADLNESTESLSGVVGGSLGGGDMETDTAADAAAAAAAPAASGSDEGTPAAVEQQAAAAASAPASAEQKTASAASAAAAAASREQRGSSTLSPSASVDISLDASLDASTDAAATEAAAAAAAASWPRPGPLLFQIEGRDGLARAGCMHLPHGRVETPIFMPVGTNGALKGVYIGLLECIDREEKERERVEKEERERERERGDIGGEREERGGDMDADDKDDKGDIDKDKAKEDAEKERDDKDKDEKDRDSKYKNEDKKAFSSAAAAASVKDGEEEGGLEGRGEEGNTETAIPTPPSWFSRLILSNTFHLYRQIGSKRMKETAKGLHRFMRWGAGLLTDSGGYQMVSLCKLMDVYEEGVCFRLNRRRDRYRGKGKEREGEGGEKEGEREERKRGRKRGKRKDRDRREEEIDVGRAGDKEGGEEETDTDRRGERREDEIQGDREMAINYIRTSKFKRLKTDSAAALTRNSSSSYPYPSTSASIYASTATSRSVDDPCQQDIVLLTPEESIYMQNQIGSDIIMQLDDVIASTTQDQKRVEEAMYRSIRWLDRCIISHANPASQALFGILQGGLDLRLREKAIELFNKRDCHGCAIGGLSGGERKTDFWRVVHLCTSKSLGFAKSKPVYVMGVGYPLDILICIALGCDMFDCVYPCRTARFGTAITSSGLVRVSLHRYANDSLPLDPSCSCYTCKSYSRAFLHTGMHKSPGVGQLLTLHNLYYLHNLCREARESIRRQQFKSFVYKYLLNIYPRQIGGDSKTCGVEEKYGELSALDDNRSTNTSAETTNQAKDNDISFANDPLLTSMKKESKQTPIPPFWVRDALHAAGIDITHLYSSFDDKE